MRPGLLAIAGLLLLVTAEPAAAAAERLLVFSKAAGYAHESRAAGIEAIRALGSRNGFAVERDGEHGSVPGAAARALRRGRVPVHDG